MNFWLTVAGVVFMIRLFVLLLQYGQALDGLATEVRALRREVAKSRSDGDNGALVVSGHFDPSTPIVAVPTEMCWDGMMWEICPEPREARQEPR